ncbi:MAG: ribosome-associated translation inhibitor RaiA [Chlorobi bacterium]|nr:ribosome-associated translation inhibitor RaiA [Chlorobiota bacterium]
MKLTITSRHFKAGDQLESLVREALDHVRSFHDSIIGADVVLERHNSLCSAEFVVNVNGKTLVAKESAEDFFKAIHGARESLVRQIRKMKTKEQRW